jgi:hypothetical protein
MRDDFKIDEVEAVKVALSATQVRELRLPPMMKAKETSSRYGDFVERHGDNVFELEAVPPEQLQRILRQGIDSVLDMEAFNAEVAAEKRDATQIAGLRRAMCATLDSSLSGSGEDHP